MGSITMHPVSRFAWPGARPVYRVHADGANDIVVAGTSSNEVTAQIECVPTTSHGCNGQLQVSVGPKTGFD